MQIFKSMIVSAFAFVAFASLMFVHRELAINHSSIVPALRSWERATFCPTFPTDFEHFASGIGSVWVACLLYAALRVADTIRQRKQRKTSWFFLYGMPAFASIAIGLIFEWLEKWSGLDRLLVLILVACFWIAYLRPKVVTASLDRPLLLISCSSMLSWMAFNLSWEIRQIGSNAVTLEQSVYQLQLSLFGIAIGLMVLIARRRFTRLLLVDPSAYRP